MYAIIRTGGKQYRVAEGETIYVERLEAPVGEKVTGGTIIVRQHGTKWKPGRNVGLGKDHTLFALADGEVRFEDHGARGLRVSVLPVAS